MTATSILLLGLLASAASGVAGDPAPGASPPVPACTVKAGVAIGIGDPCPAFACPDLNPSSPLHGQTVTPALLKDKVWIAYFGSCT